jgi:signal peptidase II
MIMSRARRNDVVMVAAGVLLVALDQLTKHWITGYFTTHDTNTPIPILGHVLELLYTRNTGVAFSILEGQAVLFVFIAVAIAVISYLYWRMRETGSLLMKLTFGLILGGAVGNLIDRVTHGYVVDFVHFQIPGIFNFAVFNLADSGITVGVLVLASLLWLREGQHTTAELKATEPAARTPAVGEATESTPGMRS